MNVRVGAGGDMEFVVPGAGWWDMLERVCGDGGPELAEELARPMRQVPEMGADWEEFVLPELAGLFDGQRERIAAALRRARDSGTGRIVVAAGEVEDWYAVLNQARLGMERRHRISTLSEGEADPALREVLWRYQVCLELQDLMLRVMTRG